MKYFPVYLDLEGRKVVIAGGGEAAAQKLRLILKTDAEVFVIAPEISPEVASLAADGRVHLIRRRSVAGDFEGAALAYGATEDEPEDGRVAGLARAARVPVNAVDRPAISDFITPAIVDRDPVTVAIGTEGTAPVLARSIKSRIEAMLPTSTGRLARLADAWRDRLAARIPDGLSRRRIWQRFFDADIPAGGGGTGLAAAEIRLEALIGAAEAVGEGRGRVSLVGAGPGDPELLTLKARRRLHEADIIVYDRLVDPRIRELARREAKFVPVGKTPGGTSVSQSDINEILIAEARDGLDVIRLKGGDPVVFGRADEEIAALSEAGIDVDIVPGITSASAAAASARFSLTRRGRNTSFRLLTAHDAAGAAEHDWNALTRKGTAFAIYMGVGSARFVESRLLAHRADPATAVTIVENASRPGERIVRTQLSGLAASVVEDGVEGPAIIFVGLDAPAKDEPGDVCRALERAAIRNAPELALGGL